MKIDLPSEVSKKTKFRFEVGRKKNLKKLRKVIVLLKNMGAEFRTLEYDMNERKNHEAYNGDWKQWHDWFSGG